MTPHPTKIVKPLHTLWHLLAHHAPTIPGPLHLLSTVSRMLIPQLCSVAFRLRCHGPPHLKEPLPQHMHSHFLPFTLFSFSLFEMVTLSLGHHMWSVLQPQWKFHTGRVLSDHSVLFPRTRSGPDPGDAQQKVVKQIIKKGHKPRGNRGDGQQQRSQGKKLLQGWGGCYCECHPKVRKIRGPGDEGKAIGFGDLSPSGDICRERSRFFRGANAKGNVTWGIGRLVGGDEAGGRWPGHTHTPTQGKATGDSPSSDWNS